MNTSSGGTAAFHRIGMEADGGDGFSSLRIGANRAWRKDQPQDRSASFIDEQIASRGDSIGRRARLTNSRSVLIRPVKSSTAGRFRSIPPPKHRINHPQHRIHASRCGISHSSPGMYDRSRETNQRSARTSHVAREISRRSRGINRRSRGTTRCSRRISRRGHDTSPRSPRFSRHFHAITRRYRTISTRLARITARDAAFNQAERRFNRSDDHCTRFDAHRYGRERDFSPSNAHSNRFGCSVKNTFPQINALQPLISFRGVHLRNTQDQV